MGKICNIGNIIQWQALIQNFIVGKTFSIPGVLLLVFIITPLSIATVARTNDSTHCAQGWLAVGFWGAGILVFLIIKLILWNPINRWVENSRSEPFITYNPVNLKQKDLKSLSILQLYDIENMLQKRPQQFQKVFGQNVG